MYKKANLNRRALLKSGAVAMFAAAAGPVPLLMPSAAAATGGKRGKVLVTIFQRFGMDGLLAVTPYGDQHLRKLRPNLMLSHPGSGKDDARLALGEGFGLHPAFSAFMPFYREGRLAIVHGVGQPDSTRSHSTAQLWWESGTPGVRKQRDGWLNRALSAAPNPNTLLPAVALTDKRPRIFYGDQPVTSTPTIESLMLELLSSKDHNHAIQRLQTLYGEVSHTALREGAQSSLELAQILSQPNKTNVPYPENSKLASSLRDIARLIKADVGLQVAFAESRESPNGKGTWDTHSNAATTATEGPFPQMATDLSASLAAFMADLGPYQDDVVVVTLTDFGRNVVENHRLGADHGRATAIFILGSNIRGGQVHGSLPERFDRDALEDGMDLPVTTDFRSVLTPLIQSHLGIRDTRSVFPGWQGPSLAIV